MIYYGKTLFGRGPKLTAVHSDPPLWIGGLGGAKCLDWDSEWDALDDDGNLPQDLVSARISIKFLLDFYLKYRNQCEKEFETVSATNNI